MLPAILRTPLIGTGLNELATLAHNTGLAGLAIHDSYNGGVLGHDNERPANHGIIGPSFNKAPASYATSGSKIPINGTNPLAFAAPDKMNVHLKLTNQPA